MNSSARTITIDDLMRESGVVFGTSGVRGLVAEMSSEICFAYTSAFLKAVSATAGSVALAIDLRPSSPGIAAACVAAIRQAGLSVDYCGAISTPALAYYAQGRPAVMVTGSHIPFERNGIKFYGAAGEITKADEARISESVILLPEDALTCALPQINRNASRRYIDRYVEFFRPNCLAGMRLGFYEHSSVARDLFKELLESLGAEVISLGRTDKFVPIDTEAVSEADIEQARRWAGQHGFDAILSTDGDGDRPLLGDERGRWFRGDIAGVLCAQYLGAQAVVTTVSCNTAVELCKSFAQVVRTRTGSPYVISGIEELIAAGAKNVVGFEPNGGFLVGSAIEKNGKVLSPLLTRDAVLPMLCLLSLATEKRCKVSELTRDLPARYTASDRLQNFPTQTSRRILQELAASTAAIDQLLAGLCGKTVRLDLTDGLRIFLEDDEILHLRASGNAPELRCYAEAATQERSEFLVRQCLQRMRARSDSL